MTIFSQVETFLHIHCLSQRPLLLALSGGSDSLCLFHCLLTYRKKYGTPFHIAHVDHGWRQESAAEAQTLRQLALLHDLPFHLKTLNPASMEGNLESASRNERYAFFSLICNQFDCQGVLTGHHQNDHTETIFKRILEGAHWSRWGGLKSENRIQGVRVLRPLLHVTKEEIRQMLIEANMEAFEDPTNRDTRFLRPRLRHSLLPRLSQEFGKDVEGNLVAIGRDASELTAYFEARLLPLLNALQDDSSGAYLDLQSCLPESLVETKYLLRLLCAKLGFFLSREMIEQAAEALQTNKSQRRFIMKKKELTIDRRRIFIRSL